MARLARRIPGWTGGWAGFTLPSAVALLLFAYAASSLSGPIGTGLLHGLKLVAVAIVAQAVWGMARTLCPDRERASIAAVAALIVLLSTSSFSQLVAILFGAILAAVAGYKAWHYARVLRPEGERLRRLLADYGG